MTRLSSSSAKAASSAFRVEAPRAGDAIGRSLRNAYARDAGIPEDMAAMLRALDDAETARTPR